MGEVQAIDDNSSPADPYFDAFLAALRSADRAALNRVVQDAVTAGVTVQSVLDHLISAGLDALGRGWEDGSVSLTQVYMGSRLAEQVISTLLPRVVEPATPWAKVVIATLGDHHGLGQRVVGTYLTAAGARVVPLGLGVDPETLVRRAREERADIIAISVLMYSSALRVREVRSLLDAHRLEVPVLVGGAPFNHDRELWKELGASAMGRNPAEGVDAARELMAVGR